MHELVLSYHHLFQPLLYQVASAGLAAPEIAHPIRSIFTKQDNVTVLMKEVTGIDLAKKVIQLGEEVIEYDFVVLAMGVKTGYFGNDEWESVARGLKTLDDATAMRRDLLLAGPHVWSPDRVYFYQFRRQGNKFIRINFLYNSIYNFIRYHFLFLNIEHRTSNIEHRILMSLRSAI